MLMQHYRKPIKILIYWCITGDSVKYNLGKRQPFDKLEFNYGTYMYM